MQVIKKPGRVLGHVSNFMILLPKGTESFSVHFPTRFCLPNSVRCSLKFDHLFRSYSYASQERISEPNRKNGHMQARDISLCFNAVDIKEINVRNRNSFLYNSSIFFVYTLNTYLHLKIHKQPTSLLTVHKCLEIPTGERT